MRQGRCLNLVAVGGGGVPGSSSAAPERDVESTHDTENHVFGSGCELACWPVRDLRVAAAPSGGLFDRATTACGMGQALGRTSWTATCFEATGAGRFPCVRAHDGAGLLMVPGLALAGSRVRRVRVVASCSGSSAHELRSHAIRVAANADQAATAHPLNCSTARNGAIRSSCVPIASYGWQ